MKAHVVTTVIAISVLTAGVAAVAGEDRIAYPANYASTFTNYLSLDRVQNGDQIIRLFANNIALESAKEGAALADGSVLVGEIYAAKRDSEGQVVVSDLGRRIRDKMLAVAVMEKRSGWGASFSDELRNGDWDFAIFSPKGDKLDKDLNTCRSCHAPLTETDHLFSIQHIAR